MAANFAKLPELLKKTGPSYGRWGPSPGVPVENLEVRLRPHHHKHRSGVGQFRRIHCSYRVEYLRWTFLPVPRHERQEAFVGRGT
jgi:hypothetical protein